MIRRLVSVFASFLILQASWILTARAQPAPPPLNSQVATFDVQQIDALLAPVALYPDSLLTQLLMASTFPIEVVDAARWIQDPAHKDLKGDALTKALAAQSWDPSVKSLVPFPQVLLQMNDKLDWMQQLGFAFTQQQQDVLDSVQRLRRQAQAAGKLESSSQQVVTSRQDAGKTVVVIEPAQPNVVYVPSYNPTVVYGTWPYPTPPVYLPPPPGYVAGTALVAGLAFGAGVAITAGLWGWASPNWGRGNVNVNVNNWNNINVNRQHINSNVWNASNRPGGLSPAQRRPPMTGPVGRPSRGGLPANAIGRPNVGVPGNLVNRPGQQRPGQGGRPNLTPGSRPNIGGAGGTMNRPARGVRPQGGGAFGNMGEGRSAGQFGQRGGQSRQFSGRAGGFHAGGGHAGGFRGRR
jgi:hypothetical protein